jgi:hypothetical protein
MQALLATCPVLGKHRSLDQGQQQEEVVPVEKCGMHLGYLAETQEGEKQRLLEARQRHRKGNSLRLEAGHSGPWNWGQTLFAVMGSRQGCFVEMSYSNLGMYWANTLGHSRNAVGVGQEPMGLSAVAAYSWVLGLSDRCGVWDENSTHLEDSSSWCWWG